MFCDMGEYQSNVTSMLVSWIDCVDVADCAVAVDKDGYNYAIYTSNESMTPRDVTLSW